MAVPISFSLLLAFLINLHTAGSLEIKNCVPAAVVKQARRTVYFQQINEATASLACIATGDPALKYTWLKNGRELDRSSPDNIGRLNLASGVGTLVFSPVKKQDAGVYQCQVQNPCGTSLSAKTTFLHAEIEAFPRVLQPETLEPHWGEPLVLNCKSPKSVPEASISWVLESQGGDFDYMYEEDSEMFNTVELGRRITMDYSGNLYFVAVEKEDSYEGLRYICMAANHQVRAMNQGEDKIINIKGKFPLDQPTRLQWHSPREVLALEGQRAKFKCIFSGNPTPEVHWQRVGERPVDDERMEQTDDQHEFIISDVHAEDAGQYTCSGMNVLLNKPVKQTFTLSVQSRPRWTKRPTDMTVGVQDNVTVVCSADADPEVTVEWLINGVPVYDAPPSRNRQVRGNALVFTNLTQDDSQVIQCNASNVHGYLWADAYIQVEAKAPVIVNKPTEQKVAKEQNITIPCGVEGKPMPQVLWYKHSQRLLGPRYEILPSGDLHIKSVNERDTGRYVCKANNMFGQVSAHGALIVREKTEIITPPRDDQVYEGEVGMFTCGAITAVEELVRLKFVWLKDGIPINRDDPRVEMKEGTLSIREVGSQDTGYYTCIASNGLDSDQAGAKLEVIAPPSPPSKVTIASCLSTNVKIQWEFRDSQSNFSPLQQFIVEYKTSHHPQWHEAERVSSDRRNITYQTSPWADYKFRVRAKNMLGVSEPSAPTETTCTTPEARPYRNPSNVHTVEDRTGWLIIAWQPMTGIEHNADGFHYVVTWQSMGERDETQVPIYDWEQDRYEVKVDDVYQPYTVSVKAVNSLGEAIRPPMPVVGYSGEAAPSVIPQNFELDPEEPVSAHGAGFRWDPVDTSLEAMNGKFTGYKIRCWKKNEKDTTLLEELIPDAEPGERHRRSALQKIRAMVLGLPPFSEIEAEVVVLNTYFSSPASNPVHFSTMEGVPSRVEFLEALFRGSSHFLLEWGPPKKTNGHLIGYQLGYQKVVGLTVGEVVIARDDVPVDQSRIMLGGLDPKTLYRIFIAAKTSNGPGQPYFIDVRTADETAELAEPKIDSVVAGEADANITFRLDEGENGERTGSMYYLEYRKLGEHGWDRKDEGTTDRFWLILEDLEPATTYEVRVVSVPKTGNLNSHEYRPSIETRFDTSGIGTKKASFLSAAWFIGMMVAIALLLFILIVVCIVKRNRGKAYTFPPDTETVEGANPLFGEPPKSVYAGQNTNAPPLSSSEKQPMGEETDSLADYGDDPIRFNEDGSFIGQYGGSKHGPDPANGSRMAHVV